MENVAGEQDLTLQQHFPDKIFFRKFKLSYKLTVSFHGAQTWPLWHLDALFPFPAFFKL